MLVATRCQPCFLVGRHGPLLTFPPRLVGPSPVPLNHHHWVSQIPGQGRHMAKRDASLPRPPFSFPSQTNSLLVEPLVARRNRGEGEKLKFKRTGESACSLDSIKRIRNFKSRSSRQKAHPRILLIASTGVRVPRFTAEGDSSPLPSTHSPASLSLNFLATPLMIHLFSPPYSPFFCVRGETLLERESRKSSRIPRTDG